MKPLVLGDGFAADVTISDGFVYVAYGSTAGLIIVALTLEGVEVLRQTLPFGFDQSFARFSGPWLTYRMDEAHGYRAVAYHVQTGTRLDFSAAGGTFGLAINANLGIAAYEYQRPGEPWHVWFGGLSSGLFAETPLPGAPDGLDQILSVSSVSLRKDTRGDVPDIWYPVRAGDLTVGELRDVPGRPQGGIGVQLAGHAPAETLGKTARASENIGVLPGDVLRVALPGVNCPDPRCATDGGSLYAIVCWHPVRLLIATRAELGALAPVVTPEPVPEPDPSPEPEPVPEPLPAPTPEPEPPPKDDPMPTVTYDQFVHHESHEIRAAYAKRNGWDSMNESDLAHTFWRRLVERWTLRDVIHDILGEPYEDGGMGGDGPGGLP